MRILEFQPSSYRNLPNGAITFTFDPNRPWLEGCSIRFLVGPNGVGKTNILRFLTGIFLALEEGFRRPHAQNPAYSVPFRLSYQLRQDTIIVESEGHGLSGLRFTINGQLVDYFPSRDQILPKTLLVYTSGNDAEWRNLFSPLQAEPQGDEAELVLDTLRPEDEMPPYHLRSLPKSTHDAELADEKVAVTDTAAESNLTSRIYLVEQSHLKLALLAVLLDLQARQSRGQPINPAFLTTLGEINVRLLSFAGVVAVEKLVEQSVTEQQSSFLSQLYDLATLPLQEWGNQRWVFDLSHHSASQGESTLLALHEQLIHDPFQFFQMLVGLARANLLQKVDLVIRYTPAGGDEVTASRTLLSDGLSDGEFSFLARMALIYLLNEEECLFLLDEPEVHFNDEWKRNLVDSIEQALKETHSEVILTSHASITLTDAFPDEVILMGASGQRKAPLTLGAEPGEILRRLFNAERTVGRRAMKYIEDKIQNGTTEELNTLLDDEVGTGFYRFKIVEELQRRVSQN